MALTVSITSQSATIQTGSKVVSGSIVGVNQIDQISAVTLASGDNTIAVPAGVVGCMIQPPVANALNLTLKGAGADTGIRISKTGPMLLNFDTSALPASIIVNSSGAMAAGTFLTVSWF